MKPSYCPVCFNNTLYINERGVIQVLINGKQMDAGRLLFNTVDQTKAELLREIKIKCEEFFKWYSNFKNQEPVTEVLLYTNDITCDNKCAIPLDNKFSIAGVLISQTELLEIVRDLTSKYGIELDLDKAS